PVPGTANSVITPAGVIRPIRSVTPSVNQTLPSGPAVISTGSLSGERPWRNSVIWPPGAIRPMAGISAGYRLPSGPRAIPSASALGDGIGNSVTDGRHRSSNGSRDNRPLAGPGRALGTCPGARRLPPPRNQPHIERILDI